MRSSAKLWTRVLEKEALGDLLLRSTIPFDRAFLGGKKGLRALWAGWGMHIHITPLKKYWFFTKFYKLSLF